MKHSSFPNKGPKRKYVQTYSYMPPANQPTEPMSKEERKPDNPDKQHFDKMLLKELVWKLDREVWAHVPNPEPSEQWSTSKAREESCKLISEYIGNYDQLRKENEELHQSEILWFERNAELESQLSKAKELLRTATTWMIYRREGKVICDEIESFLKS